jgi:hypothetical protein
MSGTLARVPATRAVSVKAVVMLVVAISAGSGTTVKDAPEGPTPLIPRLQAAAAEAPAAKLAIITARTGEWCIAGAARRTTGSGEGPLAGAGKTLWVARSSNADSSRLESPGVTAVRRELNSRRSASTAARQRGQIATCWSQVRSVAAGRRRSAYELSIASR